MAVKQFVLSDVGTVKLYKRRDTRAIKITVDHENNVRVTLPTWIPYRAGIEYVKSKQSWITAHQIPLQRHHDGMAVGKAHRLRYVSSDNVVKPSGRITTTEVRITKHVSQSAASLAVLRVTRNACMRALRQEANSLLPIRLKQLAAKYEYSYSGLQIKHLKARWGSCNRQNNISLNLFLMQLPWDLIDYVILHELVHTKVLNHGPDFWSELEGCKPEAKGLRKRIREYKPAL